MMIIISTTIYQLVHGKLSVTQKLEVHSSMFFFKMEKKKNLPQKFYTLDFKLLHDKLHFPKNSVGLFRSFTPFAVFHRDLVLFIFLLPFSILSLPPIQVSSTFKGPQIANTTTTISNSL